MSTTPATWAVQTAALPLRWGPSGTVQVSATAQPLVSSPTPCRSVIVRPALTDDGRPANQRPVYVGGASAQVLALAPADHAGIELPVADAATVYVRGASGDAVVYQVVL